MIEITIQELQNYIIAHKIVGADGKMFYGTIENHIFNGSLENYKVIISEKVNKDEQKRV